MEEEKFYKEGLSTNLIPKFNIAMNGSDQLESF